MMILGEEIISIYCDQLFSLQRRLDARWEKRTLGS